MIFFSSLNKLSKTCFVLSCFLILFIPILNIYKDKYSINENRKLAVYKNFYDNQNKSINFNYANDFEDYLKDRFWGRINLVNLNSYLKYVSAIRFMINRNMTLDKSNNMMYDPKMPEILTKSAVLKIKYQLDKFDEYCQKNNIKLYMVVIPQKEMIYGPEFILNSKIDQIIKQIEKISKISFPIDEFILAKKGKYMPFYKTDSHTTLDGAFIGYNVLMQKIKKDYPDVKIVSKDDFSYSFNTQVKAEWPRRFSDGQTNRSSGLPDTVQKNILDTKYRYFKHNDINMLNQEELKSHELERIYHYPKGSDLKVLVFGDSFTENLMDILPFSFKNTDLIRLNRQPRIQNENEQFRVLKYYNDNIKKFKPDIIVIYITYANLERIVNLTL